MLKHSQGFPSLSNSEVFVLMAAVFVETQQVMLIK